MYYYNANPKGKKTTDCVERALTVAIGKPYEDVVMELAKMQIETGYEKGEPKCYGKLLESYGFKKMRQPRKANGKRCRGDEFCKCIAERGKVYVANSGSCHVVAIKEKQIYDIWDSEDRCIGNYWEKEI